MQKKKTNKTEEQERRERRARPAEINGSVGAGHDELPRLRVAGARAVPVGEVHSSGSSGREKDFGPSAVVGVALQAAGGARRRGSDRSVGVAAAQHQPRAGEGERGGARCYAVARSPPLPRRCCR